MNENEKINELTDLLRESIEMSREDRDLAKDNYQALKNQLDHIIDNGMEGSEEHKLEKEINQALRLVFESGKRMEKVIESITKVLVVQLANESKEKIANNIFGNGNLDPARTIVNEPVDLKGLLANSD